MRVPVSVIIPCFRCVGMIERAVASICQQSRLPEEVVLIEDCSDDGGKTLVSLHQVQLECQDKFVVKVISLEENGGPGVARNAGWDAATSRYIAFLDADDAWHPRKLEMQVAWMESHPEAVLTGTQTTVRDTADKLPALPESFEVQEITFRRLLFVSLLPTRSVMIRRGVPNRFVPGKRYSEDYLLWLSILAEGSRAFLLSLPLAYSFKADFGAAGLSSHLWRMHCEVLDTYRRLHRAGYLSGSLRVVLAFYALLKFCRRVVLSRSSFHSFC